MADNVAEMTEAMPVVPAVEAFLSYLSLHDRTQLDIMLHRSGRHPDNLNWSADPKFVKKALVYGRATSGDDSELYKKTLQEQRNVEKRQARRSVMNAKAREANADMSIFELEKKLLKTFKAYGEFRLFKEKMRFRRAPVGGVSVPESENGVWEMSTLGFQRMIRDCGLLDNSLSVQDMDKIFVAVDAGETAAQQKVNKKKRAQRMREGEHEVGDLKINFEEFGVAMRVVAKKRYPAAANRDVAYRALMKNYVSPNALAYPKKMEPEPDLDELLSRECVNAFTKHDAAMKRVYGHYATLNMTSATTKKITWATVVETGSTMNHDEFITFCINFEIVPQLLTKADALCVFNEVEAANDADGEVDEMVYPAFVELLGQLALSAFANVPPILKNPRTDVSAIKACKRLIKPVPKELWFYGTIGRLFRRRGYFVGPNGSCIPAKQGAGPADERYPYKDRDAAAGKAPPGAWIPAAGGNADGITNNPGHERRYGRGGDGFWGGYDRRPAQAVHSREEKLAREKINRVLLGKMQAHDRLRARQRENDARYPGYPSGGVANLGADVDGDGGAEDRGEAARLFKQSSTHGELTRESSRFTETEAFLATIRDPPMDLLKAPWVPANHRIASHHSTESFQKPAVPMDKHAASALVEKIIAKQRRDGVGATRRSVVMAPRDVSSFNAGDPRDRRRRDNKGRLLPAGAIPVSDPDARGIARRRRGVQVTTFQAPVERHGHGPAVGGVVEPKTLNTPYGFESARESYEETLRESFDDSVYDGEGGAHDGEGGAHGGEDDYPRLDADGDGDGEEEEEKKWLSPKQREARKRDQNSVRNLDWFEEIRAKALEQRPVGDQLSRWRGKLGTKADRENAESMMAMIRRGLSVNQNVE